MIVLGGDNTVKINQAYNSIEKNILMCRFVVFVPSFGKLCQINEKCLLPHSYISIILINYKGKNSKNHRNLHKFCTKW